MNNLTFDVDTHKYFFDGKPIPNVTAIIAETTGKGWQAAQWYLDRGKAIHKCAQFIAEGKDFKSDPRLDGYVFALRRFFDQVKPEIIENEKMVVSKLYRFAGTVDLICKIGGIKMIVDYKHSIDKNRLPLQLGGYAVAVSDHEKYRISYGLGIEIKETGEYSMTTKIDLRIPRQEFLALRTVYRIRERCGTLSTQQKEVETWMSSP